MGDSLGFELAREPISDAPNFPQTMLAVYHEVGVTGPRDNYYIPPTTSVLNKAQNVCVPRAVVKGTGNVCCYLTYYRFFVRGFG